MRNIIIICLLLFLPALAFSQPVAARGFTNQAQLYVDLKGNDSTAVRGRVDFPFKTISTAFAASSNGDTVILNSGIYTQSFTITSGRSCVGLGNVYITNNNVTISSNCFMANIKVRHGTLFPDLNGNAEFLPGNTTVYNCEFGCRDDGFNDGIIDAIFFNGNDIYANLYFIDCVCRSEFDCGVFDTGAGDGSVTLIGCVAKSMRNTSVNTPVHGWTITGGVNNPLTIIGGSVTLSNTFNPAGGISATNCGILVNGAGNIFVTGVGFDIGHATNAANVVIDTSGGSVWLSKPTYPIYAVGTAAVITNSATALDFGTTDPVLTIPYGGVFRMRATVNLKYVGATFAGAQTATVKLRRTNNTATDLTSATRTIQLAIVTTLTDDIGNVLIPEVIYQANSGDTITIFAQLSASPSAGTVQCDSAEIIAVRE